jgi:CRISPR-associated protein Csn2
MKLVHSLLNEIFILNDEEKVNILVVENQNLFTELLVDLNNQINKQEGGFILSKDNTPIEIFNNMILLTEFIAFEINKRTLVNKLYKRSDIISQNEDFYLKTKELYSYISEYAFNLSDYIGFDIDFLNEFSVSSILKAIDFKFREDYLTISEKIIEYMLLVRELEGDMCFVLVNLRNYISDNEIDDFYKTVLYNKLKVLIISANDYPCSVYEKKTIIDKDLCEF